MKLTKYLIFIFVLFLSSCVNQKQNKISDRSSCCTPKTNYALLFDGESPIQCGKVYSGHFNKVFLAKESRRKSRITNCAIESKKHSETYVIEYHLSYLPDLYQIRKVVFQPNDKGIIITYSEESVGSWELIGVDKCSSLYSKNTKLFMNGCSSDTELKKLLLQSM